MKVFFFFLDRPAREYGRGPARFFCKLNRIVNFARIERRSFYEATNEISLEKSGDVCNIVRPEDVGRSKRDAESIKQIYWKSLRFTTYVSRRSNGGFFFVFFCFILQVQHRTHRFVRQTVLPSSRTVTLPINCDIQERKKFIIP